MTLDGRTTIRVNKVKYERFVDTSRNVHGREPQGLLRELIDAVAEDRVTIKPTDAQRKNFKQLTGLYENDN